MCKGFEGDYCERDINECLQSPCQNGATCHNLQGSFRCNCSSNTKGLLCQDVVFSSITSNKININLEEIVGILGVLASLILVVLLFVLYRRCRRRRQMHDSGHQRGSQVAGVSISDGGMGGGATNGDLFVKDDFKRSSNAKLSSLDGSASLYNPAAPDPGGSTAAIGGGGGYLGSDGAKAAAFADNAVNENMDQNEDDENGVCSPAGVPPAMLTTESDEASMILVGAGFKPSSRQPRDPIPPPIPTRPASYTPSTHDSVNTLNNFDTVHNYGSAADDLENLHIYSPEFLKNLTSGGGGGGVMPPVSGGGVSDSDSAQKTSSWADESSVNGDSSLMNGNAAFQRLYAGIQRLVTDGSVPAPPGAGGHPRALLAAAAGVPLQDSSQTTGDSSVSGWTSNGGSLQTIEEADLMQEQTEPLMNGHADSISMLTGSQQDSLSQLGLGTLGGLGAGPTTIGGALVPEDYHWDTSDWEPHPEMEPLHPQHLQIQGLHLSPHLDDLKISDTASSIRSSDDVTDADSSSNMTTIASSSIHPGLPVSPQPPFILPRGAAANAAAAMTSMPLQQYTQNFAPAAYSAIQSSSIPSSMSTSSNTTGSQGPLAVGSDAGLHHGAGSFPPGSAAAAVAAAAAQLDSVSEVTCLGENEGESDYLGDESDFLDYNDTDTNDTGISSAIGGRMLPPHLSAASGFNAYNSGLYPMTSISGADYIPHSSPGHFSTIATSESDNNWPDMTSSYDDHYGPVSSASALLPSQIPPTSYSGAVDPMYRLYSQQEEPSVRPLDPMPDYPVTGDGALYAGAGDMSAAVGHAVSASGPLGLDAMSVSGLGAGYTSTNASCSDISGLCEIEDSEVNLSDYDSDQNGGLHGSTLGLSSQV